jgi:hypothetical protein
MQLIPGDNTVTIIGNETRKPVKYAFDMNRQAKGKENWERILPKQDPVNPKRKNLVTLTLNPQSSNHQVEK